MGYPFPKELLKLLYGNLENYRRMVTESADEQISRGFILPEDRDAFIERVTGTAKERGLD
jgi:hypothetical protein